MLRSCVSLLALIAASAPAVAQTTAESVETLVVTATRAPAERSDLAAPVGVLGREEITRLGAHHAAEAVNRLPGVFVHRGNGVEQLTAIRSPVLTGGAGAGSFLFLEDGIPLRSPVFSNVNGLFESIDNLAARIEVIRGPGSAVYGSNALHGLINVITPEPLEAGRLAEIEAGSFGRYRLRAFAGGETGLGAAYAGLTLRREEGWRDDASLNRLGVQTRLDGAWGATNWSFRTTLLDIDQETATFVGGFEAFEDEALSRTNEDPEAFRNVRAYRAAMHLNRPLSEAWRADGVVYARSNRMDFRLHFLPSEALERTGHDSLGFQSAVIWEAGGSQVSIGADGECTDGFLFEFQDLPTVGSFTQGLHYDYQVEAITAAGFIQGRWAASEALSLEAGARLEHVSFDYNNRAPDGVVGRFLRLPDRSDDFTTFAPNLGLTYQATESIQLFARAARGVRAPQTAELYRLQPGQEIDGIDPEALDSLEAGVRLALPRDGRLELAGFLMEKRNVFFRDADGFNVTDGKTTHDGIELDLTAPLTDQLTLNVSASWAIHEYAFDRPVGRASEAITSGDRVDTAPEWLWNARLLWRPIDQADLELEWVHVGEYFLDAANTAEYDGHDIFNLRGRIEIASRWEAFGAVRNLLDDRYAERADFAFGNFRYFPSEPRSVSFGVRVTG